MKIRVKFQCKSASAYPLEPFTLENNETHLLPQAGDQITNGMTTKLIEGRIFQ